MIFRISRLSGMILSRWRWVSKCKRSSPDQGQQSYRTASASAVQFVHVSISADGDEPITGHMSRGKRYPRDWTYRTSWKGMTYSCIDDEDERFVDNTQQLEENMRYPSSEFDRHTQHPAGKYSNRSISGRDIEGWMTPHSIACMCVAQAT